MAPDSAKPTVINVKETVLSDLVARLIVLPDGRINLQDLVKSAGASTATGTLATFTPTTAIAINSGAASARIMGATAPKDAENRPKTEVLSTFSSTPASTAAASIAALGTAASAVISFGPVSLVNSRLAFSDRLVKPNYSANLSDLTGKLSTFSSAGSGADTGGTPTLADLELRTSPIILKIIISVTVAAVTTLFSLLA